MKNNNIFLIEKELSRMYEVNDVAVGYRYWFFKLLNVCLDIFEYKNLPESLPQREIELNLLLTGHCTILADRKGGLFAPLSSVYGYDKYYQPTTAVFANPVIMDFRKYKDNEDCIIIYNSSLKDSIWYMKADSSLYTFLCRYARMLADIESTANIYSVNCRAASYPVSDDSSVTQSIKAFFKKLAMGQRAVISDSTIVEKFRNIDIGRGNMTDGINDWLIARDKILEMFYRDLGVKMYNSKKAQVNTEEVESNNQLLLISTNDMLNERKAGIEKVNDMFGTDIQISINPKFDVNEVKKEDASNERQNTSILS